MEELFAIAAEMEQAAIDGYSRLAERMRRENRPDLAEVFDHLVAEERAHLGNVDRWSNAAMGKAPDKSALGWDPGPSFDDEGAGTIAPELLSAYRAFAIAVRNEERAFAFWSYLAAQAGSDELRAACERMALEELGHVATLRRERRRAFHIQRNAPEGGTAGWTPVALETRLAELLGAAGGLERYAAEAVARAAALVAAPLGDSPLLARVPNDAAERLLPCAELLLECYLDFAERLSSQESRDRAQTFAAQLLGCLSAARGG
jgi:rubrerythrin